MAVSYIQWQGKDKPFPHFFVPIQWKGRASSYPFHAAQVDKSSGPQFENCIDSKGISRKKTKSTVRLRRLPIRANGNESCVCIQKVHAQLPIYDHLSLQRHHPSLPIL